jgi:DNA-directed RNA polymerase subunit RPC12/RpoP
MSAEIICEGDRMGGTMVQYMCSRCKSAIRTDLPKPMLVFCFNCGQKFTQKAEPTEGEWYALGNSVYARRSYGYSKDVLVAEAFAASDEQMTANVNLLAASKKLLASLKNMTATSIPIAPTPRELAEARKAIDSAEGKQ